MSNELDCRGLTCPAPVLQVKQLIEAESPDALAVVVDNEAARQNVSRFMEHNGYQVDCQSLDGGFRILGAKDGAFVPPTLQPSTVKTTASGKRIMVLITSECMGHGDDGLGDMLMFNFLKTLKEIGSDLCQVAFVNGGVHFTAEGSEALPILQGLADAGVQILVCGACLTYYHLLDKIKVGQVTNMFEVVTAMKSADSVITV